MVVTLVVATHGTLDGINGHDEIIASETLVKYLRHGDNIIRVLNRKRFNDQETQESRTELRSHVPLTVRLIEPDGETVRIVVCHLDAERI